MAVKYSIAQARENLPTLVREAEEGKSVELTRRGEPVAVLIGRKAYERLKARPAGFSEAYKSFLESVDLEALAIDPGEVFGSVRDRSEGREVDL